MSRSSLFPFGCLKANSLSAHFLPDTPVISPRPLPLHRMPSSRQRVSHYSLEIEGCQATACQKSTVMSGKRQKSRSSLPCCLHIRFFSYPRRTVQAYRSPYARPQLWHPPPIKRARKGKTCSSHAGSAFPAHCTPCLPGHANTGMRHHLHKGEMLLKTYHGITGAPAREHVPKEISRHERPSGSSPRV